MKLSFLDGYNKFNDLLDDDLDNISIYDGSLSPVIPEIPTPPIIYPDLVSTSKLSSKFEIFHLFSPKLTESKDAIAHPKKQKQKKLFLARKKNRKVMKDNILKKIKSRFFKNIKNTLKDILKRKNSYMGDFKFLSQKFICDISKATNKLIWNQTLHEFIAEKSVYKYKDKIVDALKNDKIGIMTLKEIFNEYLNSKEFEESIPNKNKENEVNQKYIDDYIFYANNFINYYIN